MVDKRQAAISTLTELRSSTPTKFSSGQVRNGWMTGAVAPT